LIADVAESLGVSPQTLRNWRRQGERDRGERDDGLTGAEREELRELSLDPPIRLAGVRGSGVGGLAGGVRGRRSGCEGLVLVVGPVLAVGSAVRGGAGGVCGRG